MGRCRCAAHLVMQFGISHDTKNKHLPSEQNVNAVQNSHISYKYNYTFQLYNKILFYYEYFKFMIEKLQSPK